MRAFLVTELQAGKLPRIGLLILCALYVLPGFIGRDPWRVDDATGFGIAWTMSRGGPADWLMPNVAGAPVPEDGPVPYALAGALARMLDPVIAAHEAVRIAAVCGLTILLVAVWYASYLLARRPGLHPPDPIGARASRTDFARAIADSALLVLLGTLGLVTRMHETTAAAAQVTWIALFLFGLALALERPSRGGLVAAAAIALTAGTRGAIPAASLLAAWLTLPWLSQPYRLIAGPMFRIGLPVALAGALAWPLALQLFDPDGPAFLAAWLKWNRDGIGAPSVEVLVYLARTLPWYFWPAWPLAAWAIWRWRGRFDQPAVAAPLAVTAALAIPMILAQRAEEASLLPLTPPLALLAAVGLPTLKRGVISLIDWFAVMTFTVFGVAIWAYWIALQTGWPPRMAFRAAQIAPDYVPQAGVLAVVLGATATLAWLWLVRWRISRHPPVIWRAVVLSAGGLALAWFLAMTLWLPPFNTRNTYREIGTRIAAHLPENTRDCVLAESLGLAERASIAYFGGVRFADAGSARPCGHLLVEDNGPIAFAAISDPGGWTLLWEGRRGPRVDERFRLYRRTASGVPRGRPQPGATGGSARRKAAR